MMLSLWNASERQMKLVKVVLIGDDKCVQVNGITVKKFNIIADDYAYTNANKFCEELKHTRQEDFKELYPEFFL